MTRILTAIIIILAVVLVGIILYPQLQENRPQPIKLAGDSSVAALPFIVAFEETLLVKNRLIPELVFYSEPGKMFDDLLAGAVDVAALPWGAIFQRASAAGDKIKTFMSAEVRPALPIDAVVKPKKGKIKTVGDIKGKRFGYPPNLSHCVPLLLDAVNLKSNDVKLVEASPSALTTRLEAGELDAVWLIEPYLAKVDWTKYDTISGLLTKYITSPFPAFAIVLSPEYLKKTSKTQRMRLKIALDAAVDRIDANPNEAKQTLGKFFFGSVADWSRCRLPEFQRLTEINKPVIQALASLLLARGVIRDSIDTKGIFIEPSQMMR